MLVVFPTVLVSILIPVVMLCVWVWLMNKFIRPWWQDKETNYTRTVVTTLAVLVGLVIFAIGLQLWISPNTWIGIRHQLQSDTDIGQRQQHEYDLLLSKQKKDPSSTRGWAKLEYKFKPGQVLRYEVKTKTEITAVYRRGVKLQAFPKYSGKAVIVQKCLQALKDGGGVVLLRVESLEFKENEKILNFTRPQWNIRLVINKRGGIRQADVLNSAMTGPDSKTGGDYKKAIRVLRILGNSQVQLNLVEFGLYNAFPYGETADKGNWDQQVKTSFNGRICRTKSILWLNDDSIYGRPFAMLMQRSNVDKTGQDAKSPAMFSDGVVYFNLKGGYATIARGHAYSNITKTFDGEETHLFNRTWYRMVLDSVK